MLNHPLTNVVFLLGYVGELSVKRQPTARKERNVGIELRNRPLRFVPDKRLTFRKKHAAGAYRPDAVVAEL